ncbi:MAG: AAA family ATPase, partial [Gemmatimonadaceae bacterium]|nr:AAA family ATPase [Gemmatimonadaceae bacterium]
MQFLTFILAVATGGEGVAIQDDIPTGRKLRLICLGASSLLEDSPPSLETQLLTSGKPLALISYLHIAPAQTATREQLLELLWSDAEAEKARHTLRQTFWYIRRKLGVDPFSVAGDTVRLVVPIWSDREAFIGALDADDPHKAVRLYTGDFFPDFAAPGGAAFEQWADLERSRLRALFLSAAARVIRELLERGHAREATAVARRVHDLAPNQQASWRLILESYIAANDVVGASLEVERLERWLAAEEMEPEPATAQLVRAARAGTPGNQTEHSEITAAAGLRAELVGRESAFSEILAALDVAKRGQGRHVHVTAAPGHGKSRLLEGVGARLRATRTRVVAVRATPAERTLPYAFAAQLVTGLVSMRGASAVSPDTARTLVALAPSSSSYLNAEPDRVSGDEALRRRSLAISELVATIAHDAPVVLLIDDVHWMDSQSRTVLASVATRLENAAVLLVTAARTTDRWSEDTPAAQHVALEPLTTDDVGALVMSVGLLPAEPWTDVFLRRLHDSTKGSPLLVLETLQLLLERQLLILDDGTWSTGDPTSLTETLIAGRALQQRIASLPSAARTTVLYLSVAGTALRDSDTLAILPADCIDTLPTLETRGLLIHADGAWRVAHDEIAAISIESASDEHRIRANEVIASHLERVAHEDVSALVRAAWHRARAGDVGALDRVFARAVRSAQLSGEHAAIHHLGREVLGASAPAVDIDQLFRRLPWRLRYRRRPFVGVVAAALSLSVLGVSYIVSRPSAASAPPSLLTMAVLDGDSSVFVTLPDVTDALASDLPIDLAQVDKPPVIKRALDSIRVLAQLPDGDFIGDGLFSTNPTQGMDIVRLSPRGQVSPLISDAHDQVGAQLSPDRQRLAYSTGSLHPEKRAEIVVLDVISGQSTRLTKNDENDFSHAWSIEGTRVAYLRSPLRQGVAKACWSSADGVVEKCASLPDSLVPTALAGWASDDELFIEADN